MPKQKPQVERFIDRISVLLEQDDWGIIEPHWFDDPDESDRSEDADNARRLRAIVKQAWEEFHPKRVREWST